MVDALRGFALLGLFLVHCIEAFELYWANPTGGPIFDWVFGIFAGKSYALFALTFGLSFFLIMDGAARRGEDFRGRFVWRMLLLLGIGLLHSLIYRGDILQVLAILGLSMLLFDRIRSNRVLILLAMLCFLQLPLFARAWAASRGYAWGVEPSAFSLDTTRSVLIDGSFGEMLRVNIGEGHIADWSYYAASGRIVQILGLFLVGLVLGRIGFFEAPERFTRARRLTLLLSGIVATALWLGAGTVLDAVAADEPTRRHLGFVADCWRNLALLVVELLVFIEVYLAAAPLLRWLAAPGRMTLTLYVGQSLLFVPVFYGFGLALYGTLSLADCLWLGLISFAIQAVFARWWFGYFRYGPLEWAWRAATRTTWDVPFRRTGPERSNAAPA